MRQAFVSHRGWARNRLAGLLLALTWVAAAPAVALGDSGQKPEDPWDLCRQGIAAAERDHQLPPLLLGAIAKTESGRWHEDRAARLAWPWTVMAEGKGRFLPSKQAAIDMVKALRARGVQNIDVGCMQVNLYHHSDAFEDLEAAFDPQRNAAYAAGFLAELRSEARSWTRAVGHYHSRTILRANAYRAKVFKAWRAERHRANRERRARLQAEREAARKKS
ncbi:transglycosylase SLT domain-containing protein [Pelagibius sp.]|uniref:transglycosylase SLT domain-containing protein n=1 Tax=Pelagibius sp. TaxID=1931238 RepID=UPI003B50979F